MNQSPPTPAAQDLPQGSRRVFYDGSCPLCRNAKRRWTTLDGGKHLEWIDISSDRFNPGDYDLDPIAVQGAIHVARPGGSVVRGLDGVRAVWEILPRRRWLAWLTGWPIIHGVGEWIYSWVARHRHHLL